MTPSNQPDPNDPQRLDRPFFSARLTPHRSLGPRGFTTLMVMTGLVCLVSGAAFLSIGAWPVFCFFGLDLLAVYVAFKVNYAGAGIAEEIHVSPSDVHLVRMGRRGITQEVHLNPAWARLDVTRLDDEGVVALKLVSHGRSVDVGSFLNPPDRATFAAALGTALSDARRGGPALAAGQ